MTIFWFTLAIVFISGYLARGYSGNVLTADGVIHSSPNKFFAFIAVAVLILVSGLRVTQGDVIGDTGSYVYSFLYGVPDNVDEAFEGLIEYGGDAGFNVFQSFIKEFISDDAQIFLLICALITNLFIVIVLYKHSAIFELSLFLYITAGMYLVTMNGMRQYLASAIVFLCIKMIKDGKWPLFFTVVFLASTIHKSALIFIPVYFFVRLKPWSKLIGLTLLASVVTLLAFKQIGVFLLGSLEGTQYGHYQQYVLIQGGGANIIRVLIAAVPVALAYLGRKQIAESNDAFINILINFSVLNLAFYILAVQNWIFARMVIYFGLPGLLLLPWLIKNLFEKKTNALVYVNCLVLYFIYYYYEMVIALNIEYVSDFIGF